MTEWFGMGVSINNTAILVASPILIPQYIKHSLATAVSDFLVASGAGVFIKKTLAEVKTLLGIAADIATHAAIKAANAI